MVTILNLNVADVSINTNSTTERQGGRRSYEALPADCPYAARPMLLRHTHVEVVGVFKSGGEEVEFSHSR
jgi:hypothetical protein